MEVVSLLLALLVCQFVVFRKAMWSDPTQWWLVGPGYAFVLFCYSHWCFPWWACVVAGAGQSLAMRFDGRSWFSHSNEAWTACALFILNATVLIGLLAVSAGK